MSKSKFLISFVIVIIASLAYMGITKYKEEIPVENTDKEVSSVEILKGNKESEIKFITSSTNTNYRENSGYSYSQDMQSSDELNYKKINTYEQYQEDLKKWSGLVEMTAEDFNENFIIVISGENYHTTSLDVENITIEENNLVIDLKQKDKYDETSVLTIKLSKEYEKDNIILRNNPIVPTPTDNFVKLEDIPVGYNEKDAITDGCFVIKYGEVVSEDAEALDKFVENCMNEKDDFIRICVYSENASVIDVECKNGKISICDKNITQEGAEVGGYKSGYKIDVRESTSSIDGKEYRRYELEDEIGNKRYICGIEI